MTITNLSEDDRSLIMWDVREWCDTYEMYNPGHSRRDLMRAVFKGLRRWAKNHGIRNALLTLELQTMRIPEIFEHEQALESAYWHRAPRSWE